MAGLRRIALPLITVFLAFCAAGAWASGSGKAPKVSGLSLLSVSFDSAVVKGTVQAGGQDTLYVFEYGTTTAYGGITDSASAGNADSAQPVTATLEGLEPETTYHYRLVASNAGGTARTEDKTFTTEAVPPPDPGPDPGTDPGTDPGPGLKAPSAPSAELGKSALVAPASGELMVRRPGSSIFVALTLGSKLPMGSVIDATEGSLALTTALPSGKTQTGYFGAGRFKLTQDKKGYVDLSLRGPYCARGVATTAGVSASAARKKKSRRLWGRDHGGRFRTHGRNSHATVRGTRWMVADTCKGTYTRVSRGVVVVRDTVRKKRVVLKAGQHYLARPRH